MIFKEQKTEKGYQYECDDIFGHVEMQSSVQMDGDMLDSVVSLLLKQNLSASRIEGEVKHDKGFVKYVLTPDKTWKENDKHDTDESWNDTPISIKRPERGSTPKYGSTIPSLRWLRRFVGAFREAWKKGNVNGK